MYVHDVQTDHGEALKVVAIQQCNACLILWSHWYVNAGEIQNLKRKGSAIARILQGGYHITFIAGEGKPTGILVYDSSHAIYHRDKRIRALRYVHLATPLRSLLKPGLRINVRWSRVEIPLA